MAWQMNDAAYLFIMSCACARTQTMLITIQVFVCVRVEHIFFNLDAKLLYPIDASIF